MNGRPPAPTSAMECATAMADKQSGTLPFARLPRLTCLTCGASVDSGPFVPAVNGSAQTAHTYADCLRRCERCGVGYSNARSETGAVLIHRNPACNVPEEVRDGVLETLALAINVRNREGKLRSFCSENSEDAVTWTVFQHLHQTKQLRSVLATLGVGPAMKSTSEPVLLLWGVPVPRDNTEGMELAERLVKTIDGIERLPQSRSEPDVVLDFGAAGVVFIEVKLRSGNDLKKTSYSGWPKYLYGSIAFGDPDKAASTRLYELARNWRIGWELAGERPLTVVNLGLPELFKDEKGAILNYFSGCLTQGPDRVFQCLTWGELLRAIRAKPRWLLAYDADRGLSMNRVDLVRPILEQRFIRDCIEDLRAAHTYLVRCGKLALGRAAEELTSDHWGSDAKRTKVELPPPGKPYLVPRRLLHHNMIEVLNQCATLERLLDALEWASRAESSLAAFTVTKCHPTTSSDKSGATKGDHDLVLTGPNGETAHFEVSDVAGEKDGNRKESRDLISLGVLTGTKENPQLASSWPCSRLFMVVSREFAMGLLKRQPKWKVQGHCHYLEHRASDSTAIIEVCQGLAGSPE